MVCSDLAVRLLLRGIELAPEPANCSVQPISGADTACGFGAAGAVWWRRSPSLAM